MTPGARVEVGVQVGRAAGRLSRLLRLGAGASIAGRACLAVAPRAARALALDRRVVLVSGTNGKTTTTAMACAALRTAGPTATNATGANLQGGIAAALLASSESQAVLEVDELLVPWAVTELRPQVVALLNISRDQLDRLHEVRAVADRWRRALRDTTAVVVANADDPLVVWAAEPATRVRWVGAGGRWQLDALTCMACGGDLAPGGAWRCRDCGWGRPSLDYHIQGMELRVDGQRGRLSSSLPGRANLANAAVAAAIAHELGIELTAALRAVTTVDSVAGRYDVVRTSRHDIRFLLAKNPAGWCEVLEMVDATPSSTPVVVAVNGRAEDGRDTSWLWDVDFERLAGRYVMCSGERAADLSARLRYADVRHLVEPDVHRAVQALGSGPVTAIANYSAFRQMRARHAA